MVDNHVNILIRAKDLASREFQKLERNINKVKQNNTSLTKSTGEVSAGMTMMGKSAAAVSAVFGAMEIAKLGLDLANLGESVRNTRNRFEDLVGGAANAEAALDRMRKATRGIADDASLMQGASDLLLMGIATTAEEATQIMELAIGLKRSTDSVADALNNFAIMMGNQSYLRLDSFGISAGRTRLRVEELMATAQAATREDAFRMAVLEIGQETMDRTIGAIDETSTAFKRLKADIANTMQDIGGSVEQGANNVASTWEKLVAFIRGDQERLDLVYGLEQQQLDRVFADVLAGTTSAQREVLKEAAAFGIPRMFEAATLDLALVDTPKQAENNFDELINTYQRYAPQLVDILGLTSSQIESNVNELQALIEKAYSYIELRQVDLYENMERTSNRAANAQRARQNAIVQAEIENFQQAESTFNRLLRQGRMIDQTGRPTGFFDPMIYGQLNAAQMAMAQSADYLVTAYEAGANVTEKMANDFTQSANGAERTARQTWSMVEALNNADLSRLFGVTDVDKSLMELGSRISSLLDQDTADSFTKAVERQAGARTGLQDYFEETVIPAIAEVVDQRGPEIGANLATQIEDALELGLRLGFTPEQMQTLFSELLQLPTDATEATTINVPFTPTWQDVSRVTGMGQTELATALGIEEGSITMGEAITVAIPNMSFGDLATSLGADPGSALRSNLQFLIFGDNNTMSIDDEITINASRVTWGQIADWYGMSLEELISRLPAEAFGTGQTTPNTFAMPGTYSVGGVGNLGAMGPGMPFAGRYAGGPFGNVDWSQPGSLFQEKLPQSELDILVNRATDLETKLAEAANTDFTIMNSQLETVSDETTEIASQLDYITRSTWVIPVRVEFDASSVPENFRNSLERAVRDNGGVTPGSRLGGR